MSDGPTKVDGFDVATPSLLKSSLARQLVPVVDGMRNLLTVLGARPYRVRQVVTQWSSGHRGKGVESVVRTLEVVPTPKVVDFGTLDEQVTAVGVAEIGVVQVQEVSGRYTEDLLQGVDPHGHPPTPAQSLYYEIEFFRPDGQGSVHRRFALASTPYYDALKFQWVLTLDAQLERRGRDGRPR